MKNSNSGVVTMIATTDTPDSLHSLRPLLDPKSVAIVGASRTPGKSGHSAVRNLIRGGFGGHIFPVNPSADEIEGLKCFESIASIPERLDCAMLVIPASEMVKAARECADAGVRSVIIAASGFAETGEAADVERQRALTEIAKSRGIRMLGPNTNGILNTAAHMQLGYNSEYRERIPAGPISIVSHSGALFSGIARSLRTLGTGLCKFIPVGNEADVDMLDLLDFLVHDEPTRVIGLVMESIADGARLRSLAAKARRLGKPIVALKVGRSTIGVEATLAHSSRLAGSSGAYDALFEACDIAIVRSVEGLAGGCALLAARTARSIQGDQRLIAVTTSGAGGALLADFADRHRMQLAGDATGQWIGTAAATIGALPARGRIRNPIDLGSLDVAWRQLADVYAAIESDGLTGPSVVYAHIAVRPQMDDALFRALIERKKRAETPVVLIVPGGLTDLMEDQYRAEGIPVFHDIATAFESLDCHYATLFGSAAETAEQVASEGARAGEVAGLLRSKLRANESATALSETESGAVLRAAGVPVVESAVIHSETEAIAAAAACGYPVVCKVLAPDVAHKDARGFVITGIQDVKELGEALAKLDERIVQQGFERKRVEVVVQKMIRSQFELILGVSHQPGLGHFLLAGFGGIYAEAFDEAVLFAIPSSEAAIRAKLERSRVGRVLSCVRGLDDALGRTVEVLMALQDIVSASGDLIESIDVNPFLIGGQCIAVDALIVPRSRPCALTEPAGNPT
jgi:acyl-CoA synthetase (NDP forming)